MGSDVDTAATRRGTGNIPTWTKVRRGNRTGRLPTVTTPKEGRDPEYVEKKFEVQRRYSTDISQQAKRHQTPLIRGGHSTCDHL